MADNVADYRANDDRGMIDDVSHETMALAVFRVTLFDLEILLNFTIVEGFQVLRKLITESYLH